MLLWYYLRLVAYIHPTNHPSRYGTSTGRHQAVRIAGFAWVHPHYFQEKSMSQAKPGDTVKIHYTGTLDDGTQFDSSSGRDPLQFELGSGQVIPGFEKAVEGMAVGDSKSVNIPPEEAYGPRHEQMIQEVPKDALPDDLEPVEGMALQAQGQDGQVINLTVTSVAEDSVTVDGNHPLAGKALNFDIQLVDIARTA
jgi:peptidylprolyl isomerase